MRVQQLTGVDDACRWLKAQGASGLSADTRTLRDGDALLAWPGARHDARRQLNEVLARRACAAIVEEHDSAAALERLPPAQAHRVATFADLRLAAGPIAHAFYGEPSERLDLIAVTGTNGKTSVSWGVAQALHTAGRRCSVAGTLGMGEPGATLESTGLTTPDAVSLHRGLDLQLRAGVTAMAIEASSIGLMEGRLQACRIRVACFTNLTQDHLDYHGTLQAYWAAKQRLFDWPGLAAAVVNVGNAHGQELARRLAAERPAVALWTVAADAPVGASAARLKVQAGGLDGEGRRCLVLVEDGAEPQTFVTPLVGSFNHENLAVVAGALRALGLSPAEAAASLSGVQAVPGRLQPVAGRHKAPKVIVDYAHTPDALGQVLAALRPLAAERGGRLWVVFGCGGNRDSSKRPLMAAVAEARADRLVLTSDNPRDEIPAAILEQMRAGLQAPQQADVIEDRRAAIEHAVAQAESRDVILLAGKGHEAEQEIAGVRYPFSDVVEAERALDARSEASA